MMQGEGVPALVSVVIPVFNGSAYLRSAIDSVLAQDYGAVELIAVNDGSTDDSLPILQSYGDRLRVVTQDNAGQSAAINRGWSLSRGSILGYLSADDLLEPRSVSTAVRMLQEHPGAVGTYSDYDVISPAGVSLHTVRAPEFDYAEMLRSFTPAPGPGAFLRRSALERSGGWCSDYRLVPDYELFLRIGLAGDLVRVPQILAAVRVHPRSISFMRPSFELADESIRVIEAFFASENARPFVEDEKRARSSAYLFAARAHARAGRYGQAARRLLKAWRLSPETLRRRRSLYLILSGLAGRPRHRLWWPLAELRERWK